MTIRGILILVLILILIPIFWGKVSAGEFLALLKSPTGVTAEQWKGAARQILADESAFYKNWGSFIYHKFRPKLEQKLQEEGIDLNKTLEGNKQFLKESLDVVKPPAK